MPRRSLPTPDVAVVDPKTGLMRPDWYDFFREQFSAKVNTLVPQPVPPLPAPTVSWLFNVDAASASNFLIQPPDNKPFTIAAPTNPVTGQIINFTVRNVSGAALGAVTWNTIFKMPAFTNPATGFSRSISFMASSESYPTTGNTHSNTTLDTLAINTANLSVGMEVKGAGIPSGTTIAALLGANSVQLSAAATATAAISVTFSGLRYIERSRSAADVPN